jgi:LysR family transcriptional regulator, hydrogen peroxide-inducible genes activator
MTIQQLEYIVALDTYRHFVTAAEKCFVTQPTLTMQVKKLEIELGVKIFNRCHKPLRPTREGEKVLRHAYRVLREVNQMRDYLRNRKDVLSGEFQLGVIPSLAPYLLPLFLPAFLEQHPDARLKVFEMETADIVKALREDSLDVGLLVSPLEAPDLVETPLFDEPFLVYLPQGHALLAHETLTPDMLDAGDMLVLTEGHCFRNQVLNICGEHGRGPHGGFIYESGSIETLKRMVDRGVGYTLVPELSLPQGALPPGVRRFAHPQPVREVALAHGFNYTNHLLIDRLGDSIRQAIPTSLQAGDGGRKVGIQ